MATKIKSQTDYLLTEVAMELPCDLNNLDSLMRSMRGTGKIIAQYNDGGLCGVSVEQRTKVRGEAAVNVRRIAGVDTRELNGDHSRR